MSELGKPFLKKSDNKKKQNQCQKASKENKNPLARNVNLILTKKGLEWTMNGLGKPFRKNPVQKIEKKTKTEVKLPHVNK